VSERRLQFVQLGRRQQPAVAVQEAPQQRPHLTLALQLESEPTHERQHPPVIGVDPLRSTLGDLTGSESTNGAGPSTDAIAGFDERDAGATCKQAVGGAEAGQSGTDHDDVHVSCR
jgi:hypothetical protein